MKKGLTKNIYGHVKRCWPATCFCWNVKESVRQGFFSFEGDIFLGRRQGREESAMFAISGIWEVVLACGGRPYQCGNNIPDGGRLGQFVVARTEEGDSDECEEQSDDQSRDDSRKNLRAHRSSGNEQVVSVVRLANQSRDVLLTPADFI